LAALLPKKAERLCEMEATPLSDEELMARLSRHPEIKSRMAALLDAVENTSGDLRLADDAEDRLLEEMRRLGQESMQAWAQGQVHETEQEVRHGGRARSNGKKN
jgi:hypothetical protein